MSNFVIIMYTEAYSPADLRFISQLITDFDSVLEWSLDLDDSDRVLRIIATKNIANELLAYFKVQDLKVSLMEVFDQAMPAGS